jgi:flagellar assembly protein FliH
MSSSSSAIAPLILRGPAAARVNLACLDADLRTSPYASRGVADARLVDPALAKAIDDAATAACTKAREEGFARGHADGLAAAEAETRAAIDRELAALRSAEARRKEAMRHALATLDAAGDALARRQVAELSQVEDLLLEMAFRLATALLGRELSLVDSPVHDAVRRALAVLPADIPVTVTVHPGDVAALEEMDDDVTGGRLVRIDTDSDVEPGSCRADGGFRHVEASLSAALERVRRVLGC